MAICSYNGICLSLLYDMVRLDFILYVFIVGVILIILLLFFYHIIYYYLLSPISYAYRSYFPLQLADKYRSAISKHSRYYQELDTENQLLFERRVAHFIANKKFEARDMDGVTNDMKALISACAIQITFGFKKYLLDDFYKIVVYPENFRYRHYRKPFRGFVSDRGIIALSWQTFLDDYKVYNDGINLGIHEMAHAIKLQKLELNMDSTFYDRMEEWKEVAENQMQRISNKRSSTFRKRGLTNADEFFAVAIEAFFEIPEEVKMNFPVLYKHLCQLMHQDPTNPGNPIL